MASERLHGCQKQLAHTFGLGLALQQLFDRIDVIRQLGTSVLLVEQFVGSALSVADRAYIFEQGTIAHEAPASLLRSDQSVIASSYLGTAQDIHVSAAAET